MGNSIAKHNLYVSINADDTIKIQEICQKYPDIIHQPLTDDGKTNAIVHAAFQGKTHLIAEFKQYGADLDRAAGSGITPLMWAAARGHLETCKILLELGATLSLQGPFNLNALDFAILYGYYKTAVFLYHQGLRPTYSPEKYEECKLNLGSPWVDYEGILVSLESDIPVEIAPSFTTPPPPEFTTMDDPVADPNESWRDWLKRVVDFELPPQVERNSLPQELQPQNTWKGRLKIALGWENAQKEHSDDCPNRRLNLRSVNQEESIDPQ